MASKIFSVSKIHAKRSNCGRRRERGMMFLRLEAARRERTVGERMICAPPRG